MGGPNNEYLELALRKARQQGARDALEGVREKIGEASWTDKWMVKVGYQDVQDIIDEALKGVEKNGTL